MGTDGIELRSEIDVIHSYLHHLAVRQRTIRGDKGNVEQAGLGEVRGEHKGTDAVAGVYEGCVKRQIERIQGYRIPVRVDRMYSQLQSIPFVDCLRLDGIQLGGVVTKLRHCYLNHLQVRASQCIVGQESHVVNSRLSEIGSEGERTGSIAGIHEDGVQRNVQRVQYDQIQVRVAGVNSELQGATLFDGLRSYGIQLRRPVDVFHRDLHQLAVQQGAVGSSESDYVNVGLIVGGCKCECAGTVSGVNEGGIGRVVAHEQRHRSAIRI